MSLLHFPDCRAECFGTDVTFSRIVGILLPVHRSHDPVFKCCILYLLAPYVNVSCTC